MRSFSKTLLVVAVVVGGLTATRTAQAQSFGVELQNTMMPASGGMGGTSIARPQDVVSAINANPASMSQFKGTQFMFGGGWAEANLHIRQSAALPIANVSPYSATSGTPGSGLGNIGLTQNYDSWGKPVTIGLGLITNAGAGVDFRKIPQSNGTTAEFVDLQFTGGMSVQLTDRFAVGATVSLGEAFLDAPYSGIGAMVPAYGLRGAIGLSYQLTDATTLGMYYQTREDFVFQDAIRLATPGNTFSKAFDVQMGLPDTIGFGVSNTSLMDGQLLLALDVLYKQWDNCDLFRDIYRNQWVIQTGAQFSSGRNRFRLGYVWAENPIVPVTSVTVDGIPIQDAAAGEFDSQRAQSAPSGYRPVARSGNVTAPRPVTTMLTSVVGYGLVLMLVLIVGVFGGDPFDRRGQAPLWLKWNWTVLVSLGLCGILLGVTMTVTRVVQRIDEELVFNPLQNRRPQIPMGLFLIGVSAVNFWAAALLYILFGVLRESLTLSMLRVFGAVVTVVMLLSAVYEPGRDAIAALGGNMVFIALLLGWWLGDFFRTD